MRAKEISVRGSAFFGRSAEGVVKGVILHDRVGLGEGVVPVAGPRIVCRRIDHSGSYRIEFDVAVANEQVILRIDGAGLVAAFPEGAGAAVGVVNVLHVVPAHILHGARDGAVGGRRHQ